MGLYIPYRHKENPSDELKRVNFGHELFPDHVCFIFSEGTGHDPLWNLAPLNSSLRFPYSYTGTDQNYGRSPSGGPECLWNRETSHEIGELGSVELIDEAAPLSILIQVYWPSDTQIKFGYLLSTGTADGACFGTHDSASGEWGYYNGSAHGAGESLVADSLNTLVYVNHSSSLTDMYRNGQQKDSGTKGIELIANQFRLLTYNGGNNQSAKVDLHRIYLWNRALEHDEACAISENPNIFLQSRASIFLPVAGGPQTIPVGLASETDSAFAVGKAKSKAAGLSTETDSALALSAGKSVALDLALVTESAFSVDWSKLLTLGLATETDTGFAVTASGAIQIGLATETDSAVAVTSAKALETGLATETDSALQVTSGAQVAVGLATETDQALAADKAKDASIGLSGETDTAFPISSAIMIPVSLAGETDQALSVLHSKAVAAGLATETDVAFSITVSGGAPIVTVQAPGIEFTVPLSRLHWTIQDSRLHFTIRRDS